MKLRTQQTVNIIINETRLNLALQTKNNEKKKSILKSNERYKTYTQENKTNQNKGTEEKPKKPASSHPYVINQHNYILLHLNYQDYSVVTC